jgi:hypothetical protein
LKLLPFQLSLPHPRAIREILEDLATHVIEVAIVVAAVREDPPGTANNPPSQIC